MLCVVYRRSVSPDTTTGWMTAGGGRLIVVGASAGGIDALRALAAALPGDLAAPVCVVVHASAEAPGILHEILDRAGPLRGIRPRSGERLRPGRIYVAPPDHHLLVEPGRLRLTRGPRENRFRPAIDPLFRSAAQVYGPAAIGVILTGNLDDGVAGLWMLKQLGGTTVVQDPEDALFPGMPLNALEAVDVDYRLSLAEMPGVLAHLARVDGHPRPPAPAASYLDTEVRIAKEEHPMDAGLEQLGEASRYACPECHGVLLQIKEAGRLRFRCHTGHAYSLDSLIAAVNLGIEDAIWNALRALEEGALYMRHLASHLEDAGQREAARQYGAQSLHTRSHADALRTIISDRSALEPVVPAE
jgi:two-component system, chemotaxis family, protein-glutamate methylesterase/glutaminase